MADKVKAGDVVQVKIDDGGQHCGKFFLVDGVTDDGVTGVRVAGPNQQEHAFLAWDVIGGVASPRVPAARTSSAKTASHSTASHGEHKTARPHVRSVPSTPEH